MRPWICSVSLRMYSSKEQPGREQPGTSTPGSSYTALLRANWARSIRPKMIVSSSRMSVCRMLLRDRTLLRSRAVVQSTVAVSIDAFTRGNIEREARGGSLGRHRRHSLAGLGPIAKGCHRATRV